MQQEVTAIFIALNELIQKIFKMFVDINQKLCIVWREKLV